MSNRLTWQVRLDICPPIALDVPAGHGCNTLSEPQLLYDSYVSEDRTFYVDFCFTNYEPAGQVMQSVPLKYSPSTQSLLDVAPAKIIKQARK